MSASNHDRRLDDETLVQWLVDAELRADLPREELASADDAAASEWGDFLDQCRNELSTDGAEHVASAERVVDAVLACTVREDLGWRGDLRLLRGFIGTRMRSSMLLRVAAASLLLHLIALPALAAYRFWKAEPPSHVIWFAPPVDAPPPFGDVLVEDLTLDDAPDLPVLDSLDSISLDAQNARNADRWSIFQRSEELRAVAEGEWDSPIERRLAARALRLLGEDPPIGTRSGSGMPLDRLLTLDEALDARLLGLPVALDAVELEWLVERAAGDPPLAAIALAVLRRAGRYGIALPDGSTVVLARLESDQFALFRSLVTDAGESPLSAEWVQALRSCAPAGSLSLDFENTLRR